MDYHGVVLDLDGTVYRGDTIIDGVPGTVTRLRERGLDIAFMTNNPTRSPAEYVEKLAGMGIDARESEILSAGAMTAEYLTHHHADDDIYLIGSSGLERQLEAAGCSLIADPDAADVLLTSHHYGFDYESLTAGLWACDVVDAFYGTDPDLTYPDGDGRRYPGSGAITRSVAATARREPDAVLGKPSASAIEALSHHLDVPLSECLVVGDGLDTDITLGKTAGMDTALVLSGRTTRAEAESSDITPTYLLDSLVEIDSVL
ncbi:HAD-IIA family hydrolase [Natronomonas sp. EA1]|uniref:HAD-IIA family hydrolase n=1 Tax=Natronomonas sp. EA1 TaxID=3421655 RepID=UPI003EB8CB01